MYRHYNLRINCFVCIFVRIGLCVLFFVFVYLQLLVERLWDTAEIHRWHKLLHGCQFSICQLAILGSDPIHNQSKFLLLQTEYDLQATVTIHINNKVFSFIINVISMIGVHWPSAISHHCTSPCWRSPSVCLQTVWSCLWICIKQDESAPLW